MVHERRQRRTVERLDEWSGMSEFLSLRCVCRLFPGSYFRVSVCLPLLALLGKPVGRVKVGWERDVALSVPVCDSVMEMIVDRGACCGEVCCFVRPLLQHATEEGKGEEKEVGMGTCMSKKARIREIWEVVSKQNICKFFVLLSLW